MSIAIDRGWRVSPLCNFQNGRSRKTTRGRQSIATGDLRRNDEAAGGKKRKKHAGNRRRATYGTRHRPPAGGVTHLMRDGDVSGDPRRRAAIFRARNAVGERKRERFRGTVDQ